MIYFASRTGNVRSIIGRLALPNIEIQVNTVAQEPFLLLTYTDGLGEVPRLVSEFMERNNKLCKGIIVSGNSNFGHHLFCGAGDKLSELYSIPVVCKIEMRSSQKDKEIQDYYRRVIVSENLSTNE